MKLKTFLFINLGCAAVLGTAFWLSHFIPHQEVANWPIAHWNSLPSVNIPGEVTMANQEKGCYLAMICFQNEHHDPIEFDGIYIGPASRNPANTWEGSYTVNTPKGMTYEQALTKLVERYGVDGQLAVYIGHFISPKSCPAFTVGWMPETSQIIITLN